LSTLIYVLVSPAIFYLASRALITRWLWSRYPAWLAALTDCAACTGFWVGVVLTLTIGRHYQLSYLGLDPLDWWSPIVVGLCSLVTTPMVAVVMHLSMEHLGTAVPYDEAS
jgi:hypothetical protein